MNSPLRLKIRVKSAGHRTVSGWSFTTPYGARPGIGRCYHIRRRPASVRYVTTQEKILKNRPVPRRLLNSRWCANRWNRTMSVLFVTIALDWPPAKVTTSTPDLNKEGSTLQIRRRVIFYICLHYLCEPIHYQMDVIKWYIQWLWCRNPTSINVDTFLLKCECFFMFCKCTCNCNCKCLRTKLCSMHSICFT